MRVVLAAGLVVVLAVLATWWATRDGEVDPQGVNRFRHHPQHLDPSPLLVAAAKQAGGDGDARRNELLERLAGVPTATWLTPERLPTPAEVGGEVDRVVAAALAADAVPVLVVYGVPERDCTGGQSAGGLDPDAYLPWVEAVADAAAAGPSVVVHEPDALAAAATCGGSGDRVEQLRGAVSALRDAGVTTYVDAGHSAWLPVDETARLLREVGVGSVRGFTTNVSNYQPTDAELAWAERVSQELGGAHYLVDTGRNGAATAAQADWCNPVGQALGQEPGYVDDGSGLDAFVWVKPPAESDGSCHGGPPAGQLWPDRAVELAEAAGW